MGRTGTAGTALEPLVPALRRWAYVRRVLMPAAFVLWELEDAGIAIDPERARAHRARLLDLERSIHERLITLPVVGQAVAGRRGQAEAAVAAASERCTDDLGRRNEARLRYDRLLADTRARRAAGDKTALIKSLGRAPRLARARDPALGRELTIARAALARAAQGFNPGSAQQKAWLLYEALALPRQYNGFGAARRVTTDKRALARLARLRTTSEACREIITALAEFEHVNQIRTTFVEPCFPGGAGSDQCVPRIFAGYGLHRTGTGRVASGGDEDEKASASDTNQQNQPKEVRDMYVPGAGMAFAQADWAKVEWLLTLYFAGDRAGFAAALAGEDQHIRLASTILGVSYDAITPEQRQWAKKFTHGCVTGDHEVLTERGWVRFDVYDFVAPIAQWATDGAMTFVAPTEHIVADWSGDLVSLEGRAYSLLATPDHGIPVRSRWKSWERVSKHRVDSLARNARTPVTGVLTGQSTIDENQLRLMVAVQADGTIGISGQVVFHLVKPRKIARLKALAAGRGYRESHYAGHATTFYFSRKQIGDAAGLLGPGKTFSQEYLLGLTPQLRRVFLEELLHWDGHIGHRIRGYYTCNRTNAEIVQTVAYLTGHEALVRLASPPRGSRTYRTSPMWVVHFNRRRYVRAGLLTQARVPFTGKVYCVTVPSGYFMVRYMGNIMPISNCNYGMGPSKMADEAGVTLAQAREVIAAFKRAFPLVAAWREGVIALARKQRFLDTPFGWRRWFWSDDPPKVLAFLPSATGACMMKIRVPVVAAAAREAGGRLCTVTHDSYLCETPSAGSAAFGVTLKAIMERPFKTLAGTAFPADVKTGGQNWLEVS
jgi:DNA polymerase family A